MLTRARWQGLHSALRLQGDANTFDALCTAYGERHRHYHTATHIERCLIELDTAAALAEDRPVVEIALWFHDAIYAPRASDNEARSADWARDYLTAQGLALARIERVVAHILATRHAVSVSDRDAQLVVDVDLAILGTEEHDYPLCAPVVDIPMAVLRRYSQCDCPSLAGPRRRELAAAA